MWRIGLHMTVGQSEPQVYSITGNGTGTQASVTTFVNFCTLWWTEEGSYTAAKKLRSLSLLEQRIALRAQMQQSTASLSATLNKFTTWSYAPLEEQTVAPTGEKWEVNLLSVHQQALRIISHKKYTYCLLANQSRVCNWYSSQNVSVSQGVLFASHQGGGVFKELQGDNFLTSEAL